MFAIAAVSQNWGIGKDNRLLFHISADMKRFRELTEGKTVLMGRKTLQSLPGGKGLPRLDGISTATLLEEIQRRAMRAGSVFMGEDGTDE